MALADFFTIWNVGCLLLQRITTLPVPLHLQFQSLFVFIVGNYLSFVSPRFYQITPTWKVKGWERFVAIDIGLHLVPLLYSFYRVPLPSHPVRALLGSCSLFFFYLATNNVMEVYSYPLRTLWGL